MVEVQKRLVMFFTEQIKEVILKDTLFGTHFIIVSTNALVVIITIVPGFLKFYKSTPF